MESKITIEIHENGVPYLMVRFRPSDDLRDQVLSRFFTTSGIWTNGSPEPPVHLELSVLVPNRENGEFLALIEPINLEEKRAKEKEIIERMKIMCEQSLPPDLFEEWVRIEGALFTTRKNLKKG